MRKVAFVLATLCLAAGVAVADMVVLPNAYGHTEGITYQRTITAPANNPRSYQMIFDSSQLTNVPIGAQITGISYRIAPGYAPWPLDVPATWSDYEIRIGTPATTVATMSRTFAANLSPNVTLVQDGPYTIPPYYFTQAGDFPSQSLMFQQPWTYPGGDLIIDIRHPGGLFADVAPLNRGYLQGVHTSQPGWGVTCKGLITTTFTPTTGNYTYAFIVRLEYIPEPASLMLLLGALPLLRRR